METRKDAADGAVGTANAAAVGSTSSGAVHLGVGGRHKASFYCSPSLLYSSQLNLLFKDTGLSRLYYS